MDELMKMCIKLFTLFNSLFLALLDEAEKQNQTRHDKRELPYQSSCPSKYDS
jgi:hypothetical protein